MILRTASFALVLSGLLVLLGCGGGGVTRTDVSGKVTYKGAPVAQGAITFEPDPATNKSGVLGNAPIKDGAYDTRQGSGPGPGAVIVSIVGFDGKANPDQPNGNPIFFHTDKADLPAQASTKDFVVPDNAPKTPPQTKGKTYIVP